MRWENVISYGLTPQSVRALACTALIHFAVMLLLWLVGRGHRNDSVLDIYWGFSFVVAVWVAYVFTDDVSSRGALVLALVSVWGARLGYHLLSRWARFHGLGGDLRYQEIRENLSRRGGYAWKALLIVYVPMWLAYILAQLNMTLIITTEPQPPLGVADYVLAWLTIGAIALEITADLQLDAFKANRKNEGAVLQRGVWAWSRHPNYFANFCCFWLIFAIGMQVPSLAWTVLSPLFMSWLLIGFTGKPWMDNHMRERRPAYTDYIERTSGFFPMPPKRRK